MMYNENMIDELGVMWKIVDSYGLRVRLINEYGTLLTGTVTDNDNGQLKIDKIWEKPQMFESDDDTWLDKNGNTWIFDCDLRKFHSINIDCNVIELDFVH